MKGVTKNWKCITEGAGGRAVVHVMKISQSLITTDDIRNGAQRVEVFPEQRRHSGAVERPDEWKRGLKKKKEIKEKETKASSSFQLGPSASAVSIVVRLEAPLVQNKPFKSRHGPLARILQHRVHLCLRAECEPPTLRTL